MKKKLIIVVKEFKDIIFRSEEWGTVKFENNFCIVIKNDRAVFVAPKENVIFYRIVEENEE